MLTSLKINPLLDCETVTDDERAQITQLVENGMASVLQGNLSEISLTSRGAYIMMVMLKEQQDALAATVTSV